jgi:hypothetical protein
MKKYYTVYYISRKPSIAGSGHEVLSFEGTKGEFLDLISTIILSEYGCYKVKILQDKKKSIHIVGIKRRGRRKEFRVFIKDIRNKEPQPKKS